MISKILKECLGHALDIKMIEILSPESFSYEENMERIQNEKLQIRWEVMISKQIRGSKWDLENMNHL